MELTVQRKYYKQKYTIGKLLIDGEYVCDTLEPPCFKTTEFMNVTFIKKAKLNGFRAIPAGHYKIALEPSKRFGKLLPHILDVKGFSGVLIHSGNFPSDTSGCILPGWNRRKGMVCSSLSAMSIIMNRIKNAIKHGQNVYINVVN